MRKKSIVEYAINLNGNIREPLNTAYIEDYYDDIQSLAACLKVIKDFNEPEDFDKAMGRIFG